METTLVGARCWLHQCVLRNTLAGSFRWFHVPEWPCSTERNVHIASKDSKGAQSSMLSSKLIPHGRPQGSLICAVDSEKELSVLKAVSNFVVEWIQTQTWQFECIEQILIWWQSHCYSIPWWRTWTWVVARAPTFFCVCCWLSEL